MVCPLKPEAPHDFDSAALEWTGDKLKAALNIADNNLRFLMSRLAEELRCPGFAGATLLELLVAQGSIELLRYCMSATVPPSSGTLAAWRLRLVDQCLNEVCIAPSLSALATLCHMSVRQLTRAFSCEPRLLDPRVCFRAPNRARQAIANRRPEREVGAPHIRLQRSVELLVRVSCGDGQPPSAYQTVASRKLRTIE